MRKEPKQRQPKTPVPVSEVMLTPEQAATKARELMGVMYGALDPLMTVKIVKTLEGQAANGDHKAQQLYFDLVSRGVPEPPAQPAPGNVVQVNVGADEARPVSVRSVESASLVRIACLLAERGPQPPAAIEEACQLPAGTVSTLLDSGHLQPVSSGVVRLSTSGAAVLTRPSGSGPG